jgi:hypothetical protein
MKQSSRRGTSCFEKSFQSTTPRPQAHENHIQITIHINQQEQIKKLQEPHWKAMFRPRASQNSGGRNPGRGRLDNLMSFFSATRGGEPPSCLQQLS